MKRKAPGWHSWSIAVFEPVHADLVRRKDVDGEDAVQVEALDEEPVEHGRPRVLQQHVEALAQVGLENGKMGHYYWPAFCFLFVQITDYCFKK